MVPRCILLDLTFQRSGTALREIQIGTEKSRTLGGSSRKIDVVRRDRTHYDQFMLGSRDGNIEPSFAAGVIKWSEIMRQAPPAFVA